MLQELVERKAHQFNCDWFKVVEKYDCPNTGRKGQELVVHWSTLFVCAVFSKTFPATLDRIHICRRAFPFSLSVSLDMISGSQVRWLDKSVGFDKKMMNRENKNDASAAAGDVNDDNQNWVDGNKLAPSPLYSWQIISNTEIKISCFWSDVYLRCLLLSIRSQPQNELDNWFV